MIRRFTRAAKLAAGLLLVSPAVALPAVTDLACPALVERAQTPPAVFDEGLLFRVTRDGQPDAYLFGTMHISDPKVMAFAPEIKAAYDASEQFAMEVVLDPEAIQAMQHSMFYHEGETLSHVAGDELYAAVTELTPRHGIPDELVDFMRPWAVYMTLSVPPSRGRLPMDMALMLEAEKDGKPVIGLESVAEQTAVLGDLPLADQLKLLEQTVCHYETLQAETASMVETYVARDLAGLMAQSMRHRVGDERIDEAVFEALIWRRNRHMFERLQPLLGKRSTFVAVGALHLPGERGLLNLLEKAGYGVERVY